ncbi:hypothetical protein [Clostridium perfringens]|uniref:hypothetical protein n=1 Tax=Clostridium perfringens TaxID=1502 RepID=UPI0021496ADA|nr:hypothetical protein [Clostridium perfringens]UUR85973.1 hypothetical protein NQ194_10290 [Clostridium perfringens]
MNVLAWIIFITSILGLIGCLIAAIGSKDIEQRLINFFRAIRQVIIIIFTFYYIFM